jgi:hypothetical protein
MARLLYSITMNKVTWPQWWCDTTIGHQVKLFRHTTVFDCNSYSVLVVFFPRVNMANSSKKM